MRRILCLLLILFYHPVWAQQPEKYSSSEIFQKIQKLNFLGSVLYVAAHPDDENTRLISYLSNELDARTGYLSLTRGDGGQNLIGPQLRELLGVLRTQELLAARRIDGGEQFFTRANDFGYSKNPGETLRIWKEKEILKDVVRIFRTFRPDIIINRFDAGSAGETHGHHTASAMLSTRAFELAGKAAVFPHQADRLGTWEPKKMFFNTSPWFFDSPEAFEAADKTNFLELNTGVYYQLSGASNTEIAALSRSQHRSQGFGSTGTRGKSSEYLEFLKGQHPVGSKELFAGIDTTWGRISGGEKIGRILEEVERNFDFKNPSASVPKLVRAYSEIQKLEDEFWKEIKSIQIKEIIAACSGLYFEAVAQEPLATPGEEIQVHLEAINRSENEMVLSSVEVAPSEGSFEPGTLLKNNEPWKTSFSVRIPDQSKYTSPYWLRQEGSLGMYHVEDPSLIGLPQTPAVLHVAFILEIAGHKVPFRKEVVFKRNDPVLGEIYRPFEIVPPVSASTTNEIVVFANHAPKQVPVTIHSMQDSLSGTLSLDHLEKWQSEPSSYSFGPLQKGEEITFNFSITAPDLQDTEVLRPLVKIGDKTYSDQIIHLDYPHIPFQTLVLPAETRLVKLEIEKQGERIGYIEGAGDAVPQALEQIGYSVEHLDPDFISAEKLKKYDAVVIGIRAYNTVPALKYRQHDLMEYVRQGGNLIVQYNTNRGLVTNDLGPYPLQLSRQRVTDEQAEVHFINEEHPVLNFPNKITEADFEGWVQERGLYFPGEWAKQYTPVLSMHDPGEKPAKGSLLVASYGKGHFVYTGLSFFRELPAGVPGAYRLFANLISLGSPAAPANAPEKSTEQ